MGGKPSTQGIIVKNAIRRFRHFSTRAIARYILYEYGDQFENDLEAIRSKVRYWRGKSGEQDRKVLKDKSLLLKPGDKIKMPQTWNEKKTSYHLDPGLWLILSDIHIPAHEEKPLELAIKAGQMEKVDGVLLNGDMQDCAAVSYWSQMKREFNREVEMVIDFLDFLRQEFPKQKIVYKPGNHEYRLPRYYERNAPELLGSPIIAMETVLGLEERQIIFLDYFQKVYAGLLPVIHGHEIQNIQRMVNPARGLFLKAKSFAACSHCHSTSMHTAKDINERLLTTWSFGCLCNLTPDFSSIGNDWNWGFALINVEKNKDFEVINRRILPSGDVV